MLWPLILPFQITLGFFLALNLVLLFLPKTWKWRSRHPFIWGLLAMFLLFIPSCAAVKYVIDPYRFGWASYPDFPSIRDFRVERYIPKTATEIKVFRHPHGNGYFGQFKVSQSDLIAWHATQWKHFYDLEKGVVPDQPPTESEPSTEPDPSEVEKVFQPPMEEKPPEDLIAFFGPLPPDQARYVILFSPSRQIAYVRGPYW